MITCPRCGGDAEYLADETFGLVHCEFCDDVIDATETWHPGAEVDRTTEALPPALAKEPLPVA